MNKRINTRAIHHLNAHDETFYKGTADAMAVNILLACNELIRAEYVLEEARNGRFEYLKG